MKHLIKIDLKAVDMFVSALDAATITYQIHQKDTGLLIVNSKKCVYEIDEAQGGITFDGCFIPLSGVEKINELLTAD